MGDGTPAMGKRHKKTHAMCPRCGKRSYHQQRKQCASCGYPAAKIRSYEWSKKAKRRKAPDTGRMRQERSGEHLQLQLNDAVFASEPFWRPASLAAVQELMSAKWSTVASAVSKAIKAVEKDFDSAIAEMRTSMWPVCGVQWSSFKSACRNHRGKTLTLWSSPWTSPSRGT
ncbi:unnamed protein product [Durusdinium trenchii]|uniref:Ribosomal protein L37 n=1 Tax=Durusdinium trenchii TaxID=1381693 RepID=A0ABP0HQM1_9DINO